MDYNTENLYEVFFKDGSSFKSRGNASNIKKSTVKKEFEWVSFHIEKEVRLQGKELSDIEKIQYVLTYNDKK